MTLSVKLQKKETINDKSAIIKQNIYITIEANLINI